jgi:hypothetical protein
MGSADVGLFRIADSSNAQRNIYMPDKMSSRQGDSPTDGNYLVGMRQPPSDWTYYPVTVNAEVIAQAFAWSTDD